MKTVKYQGKIYQVQGFFCGDRTMYFLKSRFSGGSNFPALVSECKPINK